MTPLRKPVTREVLSVLVQRRPLVVTLEPAGTIAYRQKGCRRIWRGSIEAAFYAAVQAEALAEKQARKEARKKKSF